MVLLVWALGWLGALVLFGAGLAASSSEPTEEEVWMLLASYFPIDL